MFVQEQNTGIGRLWTTILLILIVIIGKVIIRETIQDKPNWVLEEEEKMNYKKDSKKEYFIYLFF